MGLAPGQHLGPFEILGFLGAGGMGEVYRVRDTRLARTVALKVLPEELVRDEERVRRFVQEARAASALSHPHVITIHEIGEAAPAETNGESRRDATPLHYIAMELVDGRTLRQLLHAGGSSLDALVGWLAQAAEGLAKAHEAGIVHRDLKPENIMVSSDGFAKVLDFGLAKLRQPEEGETALAVAPTMGMDPQTKEGAVFGTVAYMSPEQVQGLKLDARTDVFSLGCILYEAACGERPFVGETAIDVQHRILRERPRPIEELNPEAPRALQRVILRCLVKDRERRLQSMRDLALELRDIVEDWTRLVPTSGTVSSISGLSGPSAVAGRRVSPRLWGALAAVGLGLAAGGVLLWRSQSPGGVVAVDAFRSMSVTPLTSSGEVVDAAISPDGRYLAYTVEPPGETVLRLLQVATGGDVEVLREAERIRSLVFSPDGDYLFYTVRPADSPYATLFRVPTLGGAPRQMAYDVDSGVAFSPDASRIAFVRGDNARQESSLMVLGPAGERTLATHPWPFSYWFNSAPAWSPDGGTIAVETLLPEGSAIELLGFEDGSSRKLSLGELGAVAGPLTWLPDGRSLVFSAQSGWGAFNSQLWRLDTVSGALSRVTNDPNSYVAVTATADGAMLATIQRVALADLWLTPWREPAAARRLDVGGRGPIWRIDVASDGSFAFLGERAGALHLWGGRLDSQEVVRLTETSGQALSLSLSDDGETILYTALAGGAEQVFAMDRDGRNGRQISADGSFGVVSPDGTWCLYYRAQRGVFRIPLAGGEPERLIREEGRPRLAIAPDGRRVAYFVSRQEGDEAVFRLEITAADGGEPIAQAEIPHESSMQVRWIPGGDAIAYSLPRQGGSDLWRLPTDGGPASLLLSFDGEVVFDFDWVDEERVLVSRGTESRNVVLVRDLAAGGKGG